MIVLNIINKEHFAFTKKQSYKALVNIYLYI